MSDDGVDLCSACDGTGLRDECDLSGELCRTCGGKGITQDVWLQCRSCHGEGCDECDWQCGWWSEEPFKRSNNLSAEDISDLRKVLADALAEATGVSA